MMIQLPGSTVPVQVKGILANSTIPITLSTVAEDPAASTVVSATAPHSGKLFIFHGSLCLHVGNIILAKLKVNFSVGSNRRCYCYSKKITIKCFEQFREGPLGDYGLELFNFPSSH